MSAQIIRFPARPVAGGSDRLGVALAGLTAALDEQKRAVAHWRATLDDLQVRMRTTEITLRHGQRGLAGVSREIHVLREHAAALRASGERHSAAATD